MKRYVSFVRSITGLHDKWVGRVIAVEKLRHGLTVIVSGVGCQQVAPPSYYADERSARSLVATQGGAMKRLVLVICALACANYAAAAHPQVIPETWTILPPDSSWQYFGRQVAVDTSWALVQADRFVTDPSVPGGRRHEGAALLFEKVGSSWLYRGVLGAVEVIDPQRQSGIGMQDGVAVVLQQSARIFERNGSTWTQAAANLPDIQGPDIEMLSGRIVVPSYSCYSDAIVLTKTTGAWAAESTLPGNLNDCSVTVPSPAVDLDPRQAAVFNAQTPDGATPPVVKLFRPSTTPGVMDWQQVAELARPDGATVFGPDMTMRGIIVGVTGSRDTGTWMFRDRNGDWGRFIDTMQPADGAMQPFEHSASSLEHTSSYFFQRNFSYDRNAYVVNVFTQDGAHISEHMRVTHRASLVAKAGQSLGSSIDTSGNRVIVGGRDNFAGNDIVRVFDMPATLTPKQVRSDDFEGLDNFFDWTQTPGSDFLVRQIGNNKVWRQSSTVGNAQSYLPSTETTDQAIEAWMVPRIFNGADPWIGLVVRRTDEANYYYVTARSSGVIQLKRMVNGAFTTLASVSYPVTLGRRIQLRLEAIGTAVRVYLDGRQVMSVFDSALTHGQSGVATYRAAADFDNVILSQAPHATIFVTDFPPSEATRWTTDGGGWQMVGGQYRQTSLTAGDSRAIIGAVTDEQVVQVSVTPLEFDGGFDPWVGLITKYVSNREYTYVTLRKSGRVSLRYVSGFQLGVLAEAAYPVTPGNRYTLRLERVGLHTRVLVNGVVVLQGASVAGTNGRVGLVTYRATAAFEDFIAYQP